MTTVTRMTTRSAMENVEYAALSKSVVCIITVEGCDSFREPAAGILLPAILLQAGL
jgi:hypothetical protein